jgi:GNAT superfamily N-acetyltransferase
MPGRGPSRFSALHPSEGVSMKIVPYAPDHAEEWLQLLNLTRETQLDIADFAARELRWPTEDLRLRLVARLDGKTVAIGQLAAAPYSPPDHLSVLICTKPESRLSGFGSKLLAQLEREARAMRYSGLTATVPETAADALDWAERRGFRRYAVRFDSILDIASGRAGSLQKPDGPISDVNLCDMTAATESEWHEVLGLFRTLLAEAPDMEGLPKWTTARCRTVLRDNSAARNDWVIVARSGRRTRGPYRRKCYGK